MQRRLTKIKSDGSKVTIEHELEPREDVIDHYTMQCSDQPKPSFEAALKGLAEGISELIEAPPDWAKKMKIRGVSLTWKKVGAHWVFGATCTALVSLKGAPAPLVINTPFLPAAPWSGDDDDQNACLPTSLSVPIKLLIAEAECYLDNDRLQMALPYGEVAGSPEATEPPGTPQPDPARRVTTSDGRMITPGEMVEEIREKFAGPLDR